MGRPISCLEEGGFERPVYGHSPDHRYHLVEFVGDCFVLAAGFVPAYQFAKGLRGAPSGGGRLAAGARAVRANTPRIVGSFAAFSTVFCAAEIAASVARGKEDAWNSIAAGAAATGLNYIRRGARHAAGSALRGASVVAVCLGLLHSLEGYPSTPRRRTRIIPGPPEPVANAQPKTASWRFCHRRPVVDENVNIECK